MSIWTIKIKRLDDGGSQLEVTRPDFSSALTIYSKLSEKVGLVVRSDSCIPGVWGVPFTQEGAVARQSAERLIRQLLPWTFQPAREEGGHGHVD